MFVSYERIFKSKSIQSTTENTTENKPTQIQSVNSSPVIQSQPNQPLSTPSIQSATTPKSNTMAQSHEELPKFDPGHDQSSVGTKWSKWLEVWDLYLTCREIDKIDTTTSDYEKAKTLKPLFLPK